MKPATSKYVSLKESSIHHKGVFARRDIPKDTEVIEYRGRKVSSEEGTKIAEEHLKRGKEDENHGNVYIFILNDKYDLDGNFEGNTAKYINHSCAPNCYYQIRDERVFIHALRDIKTGEELTFNYEYDLEGFEEHPCRCGSPRCVGYIAAEEDWPRLREIMEEKKVQKREEVLCLK